MTIDTIGPNTVEWEMNWGPNPPKGKPEKEMNFEPDKAVAHLLLNDVIFLNSNWWRAPGERKHTGWTAEEAELISVNVDCSDVFAWGCSDAETLPYDEVENLYRAWKKDPGWGPAVWCMMRRNQMPQKPVEDAIRTAGIWDIDALKLGSNTIDAEVAAYFAAFVAEKKKP